MIARLFEFHPHVSPCPPAIYSNNHQVAKAKGKKTKLDNNLQSNNYLPTRYNMLTNTFIHARIDN